MATLEQLSAALVKADAAGNVDDARSLASAIREMQSAPSEIPGQRMSLTEAAMQIPAGIYRGAKDVTDTLLKGGASALDYIAGTNTRQTMDETAARQAAQYAQTYGGSPLAEAGRFGGQMIATAPVGGIMAAPFRSVAPAAAEALASGGMTAKTMLGRAAAGAPVGAVSAGLVNPEDVTGGAIVGAAVPTIVAPVVRGGAKLVGKISDMVRGEVPAIKAANIGREALGAEIGPALNALANARPGITATQALAEAGINADPFMAIGALGKHNDVNSWYRKFAEEQTAGMRNELATAAGGATQTAARGAAQESINALNAQLVPQGEAALAKANVGGAAAKSLNQGVESLMPGPRPVSTAPAMAQAQEQLGALASTGLKPIDTSAIVGNIAAKLSNPKIGPSDISSGVLSKVASKVEDWTAKGGGVIDADALYTIRKNAVNEEIGRLYPSADAKAQSKYAAKILAEINPVIDDAIESAGGTGWKAYLEAYALGRHAVDQQKLSGVALKMFDTNPKKFIELVQGGNPKAVEKVFGPNSYDVVKEMGDKIAPLQSVAKQASRDIAVAEQAKAGIGGLNQIVTSDQSTLRRAANIIGRGGRAAELTLEELEGKVNKKVIASFREGMKTGKSALEMLSKLPADERSQILSALKNTRAWTSGAVRAPALMYSQPNTLAPENRNNLRP